MKAKISIRAVFYHPSSLFWSLLNLPLSDSRPRKIPPMLTACIRVTTDFEVIEKIGTTDHRGSHVDVRSYAG